MVTGTYSFDLPLDVDEMIRRDAERFKTGDMDPNPSWTLKPMIESIDLLINEVRGLRTPWPTKEEIDDLVSVEADLNYIRGELLAEKMSRHDAKAELEMIRGSIRRIRRGAAEPRPAWKGDW